MVSALDYQPSQQELEDYGSVTEFEVESVTDEPEDERDSWDDCQESGHGARRLNLAADPKKGGLWESPQAWIASLRNCSHATSSETYVGLPGSASRRLGPCWKMKGKLKDRSIVFLPKARAPSNPFNSLQYRLATGRGR